MTLVTSRRGSFSRIVLEDEDSKKLGALSSLPAYYQTYQFEISNEVVNKGKIERHSHASIDFV